MGNVYAYNNQLWKEVQRFEYTGSPQPFTLQPGTYLLQCHGGHGAKTSTNAFDILGGSSFGILNLSEAKSMYAYVGGNGTQGSNGIAGTGGWNGGADGGLGYNSGYTAGSGGGGASDIRLKRPEDYGEPTGHNLPSIYTELEYVESRGSGFFDTSNIAALTPAETLSIEIKISSDDANHDMFVFGSRIGVADGEFCLVVNNYSGDSHDNPSETGTWANAQFGNLGWNSGSRAVDPGVPISTPAVYKMTSTGLWVNGNRIQEFEATNKNLAWRNVWIFTLMEDGYIRTNKDFYGRFYYMKTYTNDVLTGEWYPCRRNSDNVLGIYDKISNTFLPPYTSGSLYPGSDVVDTRIAQSLNTRIMVAGGGGGGSLDSPYYYNNALNFTGIGGGAVGGMVSSYQASAGKHASQSAGYSFGNGQVPPQKTGGYGGASGGGGGWYGGYAITETTGSYCSGNGGGGSGYVLTPQSYKPTGYDPDGVQEDFYMTHPFMNSGIEPSTFISVSVPLDALSIHDKIIAYPTGSKQTFQLPPGIYTLKCWGGDGGVHSTPVGGTRGGYSEGELELSKIETLHVFVGGTGMYDNLINAEYVHMLKPDLSWNGGGTPSSYGGYGYGRAGGGATDIRIVGDTLYDRIIVAGGAGGASSSGFGGAGGGNAGGDNVGTGGWYAGGGKQNGAGINQDVPGINGGFDYGGNGYAADYGTTPSGAGGGGWYGGSGAKPSNYTSYPPSGAGGSGYVYTNDSFKPVGYNPPEEYELSVAGTSTGGNDLPYGVTRAEIEVIDVKNYRVLCRDMYGIKGYDADAHEWVLLPTQELSPELFEEYGAYSVESDQGLDDSFETLVYDPNDEIDLAIANVVPNKLTITNEMISSIPIRKIEPEMEFDRNVFDIDILVNRRIIGDNVKILTTFEITKKMRSNAIPKIYYVSYTNTD